MKIIEALNWGQGQLKETAHEKRQTKLNPMLDAQILLAECLKRPTSYLFAHFEDELPEIVTEKFHRMIERRMRHEPVAYIIGRKDFYGRPFFVNPSVLIPRPETEQLIEKAIEHIRPTSLVFDIGTGSGIIAITLAKETEQPVIATEINAKALAVAKYNTEAHQAEHMISFLPGSLMEPYLEKNMKTTGPQHQAIIIANLPYARIAQWPTLDPDIVNYEPRNAIISGVDGLDLYHSLLSQIQEHRDLFPSETEILFEIDPSQEISAPSLVRDHFPASDVEVLKDLASKPRIVIAKI
ncbi:MAG: peptide chain release factor N(5)-glutamine methyltransferase [Patescibacteria group bacterium]